MSELKWSFPVDLLSESVAIMRPHGAVGNEGLALWFGRATGHRTEVTHVIEMCGPGFRTSPLHMSLSLRAMASLTDLADRLDRFLVGQIHSHPSRMLDLSELDIEQGIRVPGYLSLVCPHYAQRDLSGVEDCGVHVFDNGSYRRFSPAEVALRVSVRPDRVTKLKCEVRA